MEIKKLLSYFVEFSEDKLILPKKYPEDCIVVEPNWWQIIIIIDNKSKFSANNRCWWVWTLDNDKILRFKDKRRDIMVSDFFLSWFCLNLAFFLPEEQKN